MNTDYHQDEIDFLQQLNTEIDRNKIQIPQNWCEYNLLLLVYSASFKMNTCLENLEIMLNYVNNPINHIINDSIQTMLTQGLFYLSGYDKMYRPVIVFQVFLLDYTNLDSELITRCYFCFSNIVRKYCFVPGIVENWIVIADHGNRSIANIPFNNIKQMFKVTNVIFANCLFKQFIVNSSYSFQFIWKIIKNLLHKHTLKKVEVVSQLETISELIDKDKLQVKYGGSLKNQEIYWPPINHSNQNLLNLKEYSIQQYQSQNSYEYKNQKQQYQISKQNENVNNSQDIQFRLKNLEMSLNQREQSNLNNESFYECNSHYNMNRYPIIYEQEEPIVKEGLCSTKSICQIY